MYFCKVFGYRRMEDVDKFIVKVRKKCDTYQTINLQMVPSGVDAPQSGYYLFFYIETRQVRKNSKVIKLIEENEDGKRVYNIDYWIGSD